MRLQPFRSCGVMPARTALRVKVLLARTLVMILNPGSLPSAENNVCGVIGLVTNWLL